MTRSQYLIHIDNPVLSALRRGGICLCVLLHSPVPEFSFKVISISRFLDCEKYLLRKAKTFHDSRGTSTFEGRAWNFCYADFYDAERGLSRSGSDTARLSFVPVRTPGEYLAIAFRGRTRARLRPSELGRLDRYCTTVLPLINDPLLPNILRRAHKGAKGQGIAS